MTRGAWKDVVIVGSLCLWVGALIGFAQIFFPALVEFTFKLKIINSLLNVGLPLELVGIQVLSTWAGIFIFAVCAPPFCWARSKLAKGE